MMNMPRLEVLHVWSRTRTLVVPVLLLVACDGKSDAPGDSVRADTTAMASMPGMRMPGDSAATGSATMSDEIEFTAAQVRAGKVRWEPATVGEAQSTSVVPGQLVPNEDRTARLGSPAAGRVLSVAVRPGERVNRDQVLVTLASPAAGMAQSEVAKATASESSARAQAVYAASARARAERLLALKAIARQDYERAIADDVQAQSNLTQAIAELARARSTASQLGSSESAPGEIAVRSPIAGVVLQRTASPGAVIEAGAPLVVITEPAGLWLTIDAPESLLASLRRGALLHFSVPAFPGETFEARIDAVAAGLDPHTRTLAVRATVLNGELTVARGRLRPEMLASVSIAAGEKRPVIVLPDDAVQLLNGKTVVFLASALADGAAKFTARVIETGARTGGKVAVTRGLSVGDVVVTGGAFRVKAQLQAGSMKEMEM
jgi:cobalt-zinc-cadmium efflux system membrane fusion protein